ncbi:hypothetical protein ASPSYDRAFT_1182467 [Aspergillus sydowii CBS 593.65]|uniref:nitrilase n=1 Tax=Aspergillus sydowii CBS 593.65 TaxID=1036612 RepID=A0A1L9TBH4_9EURO|nr:uncharacterized protein ASPSYDRAFT_1182467 [Aspergillus sydowii CBS 593.65]OJJ56745.1 hypothetical protein ASPSYDRAFT_1182467 [Aspergillus sydowii CBS 593.65]
MTTVRVALTQHEPCWFDLQGTVDKTVKLINEAATNGARLICFPECWVPGYPVWVWKYPSRPDLFVKYFRNSLAKDSPEMDRIRAAAKENNIVVVLAYSERADDSLYMSQSVIDATGEVLLSRRKIKPTHMERTIFGDAAGGDDTLFNVAETAVGRVSTLVCWEHLQPLLKYHTLSQRPQIHVGGWPPLGPEDTPGATASILKDGARALTRVFAMESQAFGLHTSTVISTAGVEVNEAQGARLMSTPGGGASIVYGPDGKALTEDLPETEEGMVYCDLNMDTCVVAKSFIDCIGQYSRPDILSLSVDQRPRRHVHYAIDASELE